MRIGVLGTGMVGSAIATITKNTRSSMARNQMTATRISESAGMPISTRSAGIR